MATYYFDSVNGNDSNPGTDINAPKATYDAWTQASTAAGDRFLFKRGTTQLITTSNKSLIGGTAAAPVYYGAYGPSHLPRPKFITTNTATGIFNQSRRSHYIVEDWHFDMEGAEINSLYISATSLGDVTNVRIRRCLFENAGGDFAGLYIGREASAFVTYNVEVHQCVFRGNGADGITVLACSGVLVKDCVGYDNGSEGPNGGHNFRLSSRKNTVTSGWSLVGGTIYRRALAAHELDVYFVQTPTYARATKTTGPSPSAGQFSVYDDAGTLYLYINNNANPSGVSITFVWDACVGCVFEGCVSFNSLWNRAAPFQEGHGLSLDDFVSNCQIIGCVSFNNEGLGISINGGDNNLIQGCLIYNNSMRGVSVGSGQNNRIINNTIVHNNRGEGASDNEIGVGGTTSTGTVVSNNIIVSDEPVGVAFGATTGCVAQTNRIYGPADPVDGGTETGTTTTDPKLGPNYAPTDATLEGAGTYLGGRDLYGKEFNSPPNIGHIEDWPARSMTTRSGASRSCVSRSVSPRRAMSGV